MQKPVRRTAGVPITIRDCQKRATRIPAGRRPPFRRELGDAAISKILLVRAAARAHRRTYRAPSGHDGATLTVTSRCEARLSRGGRLGGGQDRIADLVGGGETDGACLIHSEAEPLILGQIVRVERQEVVGGCRHDHIEAVRGGQGQVVSRNLQHIERLAIGPGVGAGVGGQHIGGKWRGGGNSVVMAVPGIAQVGDSPSHQRPGAVLLL